MIVRPRTLPSGTVVYELDYGLVEGRRKRENFASKADADTALRRANEARRRFGLMGLSATTAEMAEYLNVKQRLATVGSTVTEAVEFYLVHSHRVTCPLLLSQAVQDFIWDKREAQRSRRTLNAYQCILGGMVKYFPTSMVHEMTMEGLLGWMRGQTWTGVTHNSVRRFTQSFFSWALGKRMCSSNPAKELPLRGEGREEISTLSVEECEQMLATAMKVAPGLLPMITLGLFCGIRRAELGRMRWSEVQVSERMVVVLGKTAKTRQRRVIDLSANAAAWLRRWMSLQSPEVLKALPGQKVVPPGAGARWPAMWKAAGLLKWPKNALRHTFASMHYALHQDEAKLQAMMGHESAAMLHKHYRALRTKKEAAAFWKLRPGR